jgi:hypothetical protein
MASPDLDSGMTGGTRQSFLSYRTFVPVEREREGADRHREK